MVTLADWKWIVDLGAKTSRNFNSHIVIVFVTRGNSVVGMVKGMPFKLLLDRVGIVDVERFMQEVVEEAEGVFLNAYFDSML